MSLNVGEEIVVRITGISKFGLFFETDERRVGLVHISEVSDRFIQDLNVFFKKNDRIKVKIVSIDTNTNKINASYKQIDDKKINRYLVLGATKLLKNTEVEMEKKYREISYEE